MKLHGLPYMYIGHLLSAMLDLTQTALCTPVADSDLEQGRTGLIYLPSWLFSVCTLGWILDGGWMMQNNVLASYTCAKQRNFSTSKNLNRKKHLSK